MPEQEVRTLAVAARERERFGEELLRGSEGVQSECAIARTAERRARPPGELLVDAAGCAGELERRRVMVRDELRMVFGAAEALDPFRRTGVLLGAHRARDLSVRDVAHEHVP